MVTPAGLGLFTIYTRKSDFPTHHHPVSKGVVRACCLPSTPPKRGLAIAVLCWALPFWAFATDRLDQDEGQNQQTQWDGRAVEANGQGSGQPLGR